MTFILWTIWAVIIAVIVNIVMEKLWDRIGSFPSKPRDERGEVDMSVLNKPRHRG